MSSLLLINGPNLNLLGEREPGIYGDETLPAIEQRLMNAAKADNFSLQCFQSNSESAIVERIQQARKQDIQFIIINPAAFTHTSVAIRDALAAVAIPFIELHLSNPHRREPFRHHSYFTDLAVGVIAGFGAQGYLFALTAASEYLTKYNTKSS